MVDFFFPGQGRRQPVCTLRWRKKNHHRRADNAPCMDTHAGSNSSSSSAVNYTGRSCAARSKQPSICTPLGEQNQQAFSPPDIHTFPYVTGAEVCALKAACQIQGLGGSTNASSTLDEIEGGKKIQTQTPRNSYKHVTATRGWFKCLLQCFPEETALAWGSAGTQNII